MRVALVSLVCLIVAIFLAPTASGQNPPNAAVPNPGGRSLFLTTRIDGAIVVYKSRTGADLVEVSILNPEYSQELLRRQIALLGKELGSQPRGVDVGFARTVPSESNSSVLRATFAVDGLIDRANGILHVQAIARAFAIATPKEKLDAVMIQFQHEAPTATTLRSCAPPEPGCNGAIIEGRADRTVGIEYRLKFLSHNPDEIELPDTPRDVPARKVAVPPKTPPTDWTMVVLVFVGAAAAGALVYSVLLGRRRRNSPRSGTPRGGSSGGSGGGSQPRRPRMHFQFTFHIV